MDKRLMLILASRSPRRNDLLQQFGYRFRVMPSRAEELTADADNVREIVVENAERKGREVISRIRAGDFPESDRVLVVGADTLVSMAGKVFGKPKDLDEALAFLQELGGKPHQVHSGVFLHDLTTATDRSFCVTTQVTIKPMTEAEILRLFQKVTPLDKAAGYGFQSAPEIVSKLEGCANNVIGLPMDHLTREIDELIRNA